MADITTTIRNAKPGYYVDIRSPDGQIDAFPIERLWELLDDDDDACGCTPFVQCHHHFTYGVTLS